MDSVDILEKNAELRGLHAGRRCFIVGSGPSIARQDLMLLKDEIKIVVNHFYRHEHFKEIGPDYWVCADPSIWNNRELFLTPLLGAIEEKGLNSRLFFPLAGMVKIDRGIFLNLHYFRYDYSVGIEKDIDFTAGIPPYGQNVALVALMLAMYLGCDPIYMLGFEHTWWGWKRENYDRAESPAFYKAFYSPMSQREDFDWIQSTIFVQKFQYLQLIKYAQKRGFRIFNATEGGFLDLFPRARYEDLFPPGTGRTETGELISALPDITSDLARSAIELINRKNYGPALVLVDEARRQNTGKDTKIDGLDYLKAVCLTGLGEHRSAIEAARQDYCCNPSNRDKTMELLRSLGDDLLHKEKVGVTER